MVKPTVQTATDYVAAWDNPRVFVHFHVGDEGELSVTVNNDTVVIPAEYGYDAGKAAKLVRNMVGGAFIDRGFMHWLNRNVKDRSEP